MGIDKHILQRNGEREREKVNTIATKHLCGKNSAANKQPPIKQSKMEF